MKKSATRYYSEKQKAALIDTAKSLLKEDKTIQIIADLLNIPFHTLYKWLAGKNLGGKGRPKNSFPKRSVTPRPAIRRKRKRAFDPTRGSNDDVNAAYNDFWVSRGMSNPPASGHYLPFATIDM
jgi:transposase-like protein